MPEWAWPALIGVLFTLFAFMLRSVYQDLAERVRRGEDWRMDQMADVPSRLTATERDLRGMHDWKHEKVDPYLPTEMKNHKERIERIERKMFNGNHP